ncbi:MAG: LamG domain-containing protein [Candidatus Verstraetearchaeota archaeon]|nr:LamG domain-containing protein [Candidatus Verstraetearchaeota archaeon]
MNRKKNNLCLPTIFLSWMLIVTYSTLVILDIFPLVRIFLVLPTVYILPGMFLYIFFINKTNASYEIIPVIVKSFVISQLLVILLMYILLAFKIPLNAFTFIISLISYFLLINVLLLLRRNSALKHNLSFCCDSFNLFLVIFVFLIYLLIIRLFFPYKTLDRDETDYLFFARNILLKNEVLTTSQNPLASWIENLFRGRIFLISLIATYILSTNLQWGYAWIMGSMFIPMTALAAVLLIPSSIKYEKAMKVSTTLLLLSNPLILTFGRSVQPDLAQAFYTTLAIYYVVKSFKLKVNKTTENSEYLIDIRYISFAIVILTISFTIRENIGIFLAITFTMIILNIIYGLRENKRIFILLFIFSILLISFSQLIRPIGLVIPNFESYTLLDYVKRLYTILSPEAINPLISLNIISLPALLRWALKKNDYEIGALSLIALFILAGVFFFSLTDFEFFYNISRYELFMLPVLTVLSLTIIFSYNSRYISIFIAFSMILFLWLNYIITLSGSPVFLNGPYEQGLRNTFIIIFVLFLSIFFAAFISNMCTSLKFRVKILKENRKFECPLSSLAFVIIVFSALLSNIHFSQILAFSYSKYAQNYDLTNVGFFGYIGEQSVVLSNFYYYLRLYVPDKIFSKSILLSIPIEEKEYLNLIKILPKNAYLVLTDDPRLAWYEYGNKYINKYIFEVPNVSISRNALVLHLSFDTDIVRDETGNLKDIFVHNVAWCEGKKGKALYFNGKDSYVKISNSPSLTLTNEISIEAWVKCGDSPDGNHRTIVRKEGAFALRFDPQGNLEALIWQNGRPQSSGIVPSSIAWVPGKWVHWFFTFDGRYMRIYKDGDEVIERFLTGKIDVSSADLGIGASGDGKYPFLGCIDEIYIYNKSLSAEEIKMKYLQEIGYANLTFIGSIGLPKGKIILYKPASSVVWKEGESTLKVNEITIIPAYKKERDNVTLHVTLWSGQTQKAIIIINTYRFSKILEAYLKPGINDLKFNFSYVLPDGKTYGSQIQGWSEVIILDANGNIAFHDILAAFKMQRNSIPMFTWILFLIIIISFFLILERKMLYQNSSQKCNRKNVDE